MKAIYVADADINTYPGGAEKVDYNIYSRLSIEFIKAQNLQYIDKSCTYLLGNATQLSQKNRDDLIKYKNYCIFEHDYKIHQSRQPHRYPSGVFPIQERINYDFYQNAKVVFLQTKDHQECFGVNNVPGNFVVTSTSVWSDTELDSLATLSSFQKSDYRYCILGNKTSDKGSDIAIGFCQANTLDYVVMPTLGLEEFYKELAKYSTLVYFPRVRESFCRLVVEARCLRMNIITSKNYGAVKEDWFYKSGTEMVDFLRTSSDKNIELIKSYL